MPIPQEFNCNEVHLTDKEIEAFQTAIRTERIRRL